LREPVHIPAIALRRGGGPLHRQIREQIASEIRGGTVRDGSRLPSTRVLAAVLGVSRNTVLAAYDELVSNDIIEGSQGSGMRVKGAVRIPAVNLPNVMRAARYPVRVVFLNDPDGNPLAVNY
jgi:GntR family transcriptional regulator / MocR family aminotransferase